MSADASSGWSVLGIIMYEGLLYGIVGIILFIRLANGANYKKFYSNLRPKLLYLLLFLQICSILSMVGDYGDTPGVSPEFYKRILTSFNITLPANISSILGFVFGIGAFMYFFVFIVYMVLVIKDVRAKETIENRNLPENPTINIPPATQV
jgi:hypothetical protein